MATLADLVAPKPEPKGRTMLRDLVRGFNREAVAGVLGAPVDMANTLANLLIAGGGLAAHKAGLINQPPDLIDPARAVGSSDWIYNRLPAQPAMTGSGAETAGRLVGAIASPPAIMATAPRTLGSLVRYGMERAPKAAENYVRSLGGLTDAIVYHGSPHKFDAFDMSKIGTGEGAQAYGHGLYLAESPDVARSYRKAGVDSFEPMYVSTARNVAQDPLYGATLEEKVSSLLKSSDKKAADYLRANYQKLLDQRGHLYTVDLPDSAIARMLDWDKPLSQQAAGVREALAKAQNSFRQIGIDPSGQRVLQSMEDIGYVTDKYGKGMAGVSAYLRDRGIPGIRYLDGVSRVGGAGTSNYVVFDDKLPKILRRE